MATKWLSSVNGSDSNDGSTKALAKATWGAAIGVMAAGDTLKVDSAHTESFSSNQTWGFPGTESNPNYIYTINWTTEAYEKATSANASWSTNNDLTISGSFFIDGVYIDLGDDLSNTQSNGFSIWSDHTIEFSTNNFSQQISAGSTDDYTLRFNNPTIIVSQATASTAIVITVGFGCNMEWYGGVISCTGGSFSPTGLFDTSSRYGTFFIDGCDFSQLSGGNIFQTTSGDNFKAKVINCKLNASTGYINTSPNTKSAEIEFIGCDDGTGNALYNLYRADAYGVTTHDDGVYRTGGASDGTTGISWKMVSNSSALEYYTPHRSGWIEGWIDSTGSKTFTCHIANNSATALQDDEIWLEIEYLGSATGTNASFSDDRMASPTATPANQTTSTEAWTGLGGTNTKQQLEVTATVNRVGPFRARVHLAKPSQTVYVCPKIEVS